MASPTVLHVGAMKSGTSSVQDRLCAAHATLARYDVLVPASHSDIVLPVLDLLEVRRQGAIPHEGRWPQLVEKVRAHPGRAVLSQEFLGPARPEKVRRVVEDLGDVEVVITARDLGRNLPAMWQETLQNGRTWDWAGYVADARTPGDPVVPGGAGRRFWRQQDIARIAARWAEAVGPQRVTMVTVPPPGADPDLLWNRFCEAAGIDPAWAPPRRSRTRPSGRRPRSCSCASTQCWRRAGCPGPTTTG